MLSILVAERNGEFREQIKNVLQKSYTVFEADSGIEAIELCNRETISMFLINSETPFIAEQDFLQRFERMSVRPVLFYGDKIDCTMTENYPFIEFFETTDDVHRILELVDSTKYHHFGESEDPRYFKFQDIEIDYLQRSLSICDQSTKLTPKEYDLLTFLMNHSGEYFTREDLLVKVWGYDFIGDSRTIDTHIKSLRNKLGCYRTIVVTVWGKGYKIELPQPTISIN